MASEEREVVRVRVKKCEGALPAESRSFAVDPQITSLDVLHHILIRAFELHRKSNFGVSYLCRNHGDSNQGEGEAYLSILSDTDLEAAFAHSADPCLLLKMDVRPAEDSPLLEGWDIISPKDVISSDLLPRERRGLAAAALPFTQSLLSQVGRTLSRVQQALSWSYAEEVKPFKPPLSDAEFHSFLNSQGQLCHPEGLRLRIYHGGVEPSLRKVVWRYLLNVYPDGLTGQQRMDYMKRKTREYERLKGEWPTRVAPGQLDVIRGNVMKDVLRTDRTHPYYAGSEDNPHLTALADLLTTYAVTHPKVSYRQGMSDIASPILAVMDNEAHAYVCFCGAMRRLEGNFLPDGGLMSLKFRHLRLLLERCDPVFHAYLARRGADGLLFCYRWLLLELKREFAFEHALRMLEVCWSSLPPDPPETEVELVGRGTEPGGGGAQAGTETGGGGAEAGTETGGGGAEAGTETGGGGAGAGLGAGTEPGGGGAEAGPEGVRADGCEGEGVECRGRGEGEGGSVSGEREEGVVASPCSEKRPGCGEYNSAHKGGDADLTPPPVGGEANGEPSTPPAPKSCRRTSPNSHTRAPLSSPPNTQAAPGLVHASSASPTDRRTGSPNQTSVEHASTPSASDRTVVASPGAGFSAGVAPRPRHAAPLALPPPQELGRGNPFMLFLCVSLLLEQREHVMRSDLDHNELAMHFDRLVRRHSLSQVLHRARALFADYLQSAVWDSEEHGDEVSLERPAPTARTHPLLAPSGSASLNSTYRLSNTVPSEHLENALPPVS